MRQHVYDAWLDNSMRDLKLRRSPARPVDGPIGRSNPSLLDAANLDAYLQKVYVHQSVFPETPHLSVGLGWTRLALHYKMQIHTNTFQFILLLDGIRV